MMVIGGADSPDAIISDPELLSIKNVSSSQVPDCLSQPSRLPRSVVYGAGAVDYTGEVLIVQGPEIRYANFVKLQPDRARQKS